MNEQPHALDYHATRRRGRRSLIIFAACVIVAMVLVLAAWKYQAVVGQYWRRFNDMRADQRAMAYQPPAGQVVWDDTSGTQAVGDRSGFPRSVIGGSQVFQHGRKTSGGQEVLVMIELVAPRSQHGEHLAVTLYEPGTLQKWRRHFGPDVAWEAPPIVGGGPKKIYAGKADPKDTSHFTIEYVVNGQKRVLDGWLIDVPKVSSGATTALRMTDRRAMEE